MDPVAARRLLSGRQVVHGVHTLLWALDLWQAEPGDELSSLSCEFSNPVNVGDQVVFTRFDEERSRSTIAATVASLRCTHITIETHQDISKSHCAGKRFPDATRIGLLNEPLDEPPTGQAGRRFIMDSEGAGPLALRFTNAAAWLLPERLAALATLSRFVGMVCPGLHSVFSSVRLELGEAKGSPDELTFEVKKYDDRFGLFIVAFEGCIRGEIRAFQRPPPIPQPSMRDVAARVSPGEFRGARSLVIGGSRGLGETVAKILAAGSGDVTISWASGAKDAQRVADEINAHAAGRCKVLKFDLTTDAFDSLGVDARLLDSVYFFATPRIFRKKEAVFDRLQFEEFLSFYVDRFKDLCMWLENGERQGKVKVYFPSTVFVSDRTKGLTEYAMAKSAAEVFAEDLNRSLDNVRIVSSRLPRLATDQTSSILHLGSDSTLDALLPVVRRLDGQGSEV